MLEELLEVPLELEELLPEVDELEELEELGELEELEELEELGIMKPVSCFVDLVLR